MDTWDKILAELERILSGTYESPDAMAAELAPLYEAMQALIGAGTASDATEEQASEALKQGRIAMLKFTQIETKIKAKRANSPPKNARSKTFEYACICMQSGAKTGWCLMCKRRLPRALVLSPPTRAAPVKC